MAVSYSVPLGRAWARAKRMLFRPFRIDTWLVLGFAAFLSEYLTGSNAAQFGFWRGHDDYPGNIGRGVEGLLQLPLWIAIAVALGVVVTVVVVVLMWLCSRGKFIFLDNVAHERTGIVEPWRRFKRLGNSLFAWWLGLVLVWIAACFLMAIPFLSAFAAMWSSGTFHLPALGVLLGFWLMLIPIFAIFGYVLLFLFHFVVPIMYKHDITASAAWGRFLPLLRQHPGSFLVYGFMIFVLWLAVGIACAAVGFSTCCVGFFVLGFPYIGTVVLLPVWVTFRAIGHEFLAQFGPDFTVLAEPAPVPVASPGSGAPPVTPAPPMPGGAS